MHQSEVAECGLCCLGMVLGFHGMEVDLPALRRRFSVSSRGLSAKQLMDFAAQLKLGSRAVRVELGQLARLQRPAILHWDMNHFVVLKSVGRRHITIADPARGLRRVPLEECSRRFTGVAIECWPQRDFKRGDARQRLRISDLWSGITGLRRFLIQTLVLSVILQCYVLISPFYLQLAVDDVLAAGNVDLLLVLALGFGGFLLFNAVSEALRGLVLASLGHSISYQLVRNLLEHLFHLPLSYFEKRHIGGVISRFDSIQPFRAMLAEGLVATVIDGAMAILTLTVMFFYSPLLATLAILGIGAFFALRFATHGYMRRCTDESILAKARQHSTLIESLRGMMTVKLAGAEADRARLWQNQYARQINTEVALDRAKVWFTLGNRVFLGLEGIVFVYLCVLMTLEGGFTLGMIFAFMAYKRQFIEKTTSLVERIAEFRMLRLHLDRLADITQTKREPQGPSSLQQALRGAIEFRNVSFRYGKDGPLVLQELSFSIAPGEMVVLSGPSGCGKTTLLKLTAGLLKPTAGEILIDGLPLREHDLQAYRRRLGAVMQEDTLFAGTIADNIASFESDADPALITKVARHAQVHDAITAMPMRYETLVGDMGSTLSGGQRQRVMLARALYRQPNLLIMDEGTAHLDAATEALVWQQIQQLSATRLVISHHPEAIHGARTLTMRGGRLVEDAPQCEQTTRQSLPSLAGAGAS